MLCVGGGRHVRNCVRILRGVVDRGGRTRAPMRGGGGGARTRNAENERRNSVGIFICVYSRGVVSAVHGTSDWTRVSFGFFFLMLRRCR